MSTDLTIRQTLAFFSSVIKSGEPWTDVCQKAYDDAAALLDEIEGRREPKPADFQTDPKWAAKLARNAALEDAATMADSYAVAAPKDVRTEFQHGWDAARSVISDAIRALKQEGHADSLPGAPKARSTSES